MNVIIPYAIIHQIPNRNMDRFRVGAGRLNRSTEFHTVRQWWRTSNPERGNSDGNAFFFYISKTYNYHNHNFFKFQLVKWRLLDPGSRS
jgi:hypothetical protein